MSKRAVVVVLSAVICAGARADAQQVFTGSRTIAKGRLVRAYLPCTDPIVEHAPPWRWGCTPLPSSSFDYAARGSGSYEIKAITSGGRVTDLRLAVTMNGVQTDASTPVDDMTFALAVTLRLTDHGCSGASCTAVEGLALPLLVVPCGRAADPPLPPGRCAGSGTLNGAVFGGITPGAGGAMELHDLALVVDGQPAFVPGTPLP